MCGLVHMLRHQQLVKPGHLLALLTALAPEVPEMIAPNIINLLPRALPRKRGACMPWSSLKLWVRRKAQTCPPCLTRRLGDLGPRGSQRWCNGRWWNHRRVMHRVNPPLASIQARKGRRRRETSSDIFSCNVSFTRSSIRLASIRCLLARYGWPLAEVAPFVHTQWLLLAIVRYCLTSLLLHWRGGGRSNNRCLRRVQNFHKLQLRERSRGIHKVHRS